MVKRDSMRPPSVFVNGRFPLAPFSAWASVSAWIYSAGQDREFWEWERDRMLGYLCDECPEPDVPGRGVGLACRGLAPEQIAILLDPRVCPPHRTEFELLQFIADVHGAIHEKLTQRRPPGALCAQHARGHRQPDPCGAHLSAIDELTGLLEGWSCDQTPEARRRGEVPAFLADLAQMIQEYGVVERVATEAALRRARTHPRGGPGPAGYRAGRDLLRALKLPPSLLPARRDIEKQRPRLRAAWERRVASLEVRGRAADKKYRAATAEAEQQYASAGRPYSGLTREARSHRGKELKRAFAALVEAKTAAAALLRRANALARQLDRLRREGPPQPAPPARFWTEIMGVLRGQGRLKTAHAALILTVLVPTRYPDPKDHSLRVRIARAAKQSDALRMGAAARNSRNL